MRPRTTLILVVTSLLLAGAVTSSASPTPEARLATDSSLVSVPTHADGTTGTDECEGEAPDTSVCSTGLHLILGGHASHGFPTDQGSFTGTLESTIQSLFPPRTESRTFRCDFDNGHLGQCSTEGSFPASISVFVHTCQAYELGTDDLGGSGSWKCFVEHS